MMKRIFTLLFVSFIVKTGFSQFPGFHIDKTTANLLDANNNNFIMKGMNIPLAWYVNDVQNSIDEVRTNTKSNCVRIVVQLNTSDAVWQAAVDKCIANQMIPMLEIHDYTGSTNTADPNTAAQWFTNTARATYLKKPEIAKYILINICNEWGTWDVANSFDTRWRNAFQTAVQTIRAAGIKTTIVIDAVGYGQDLQSGKNIKDYGKAIMQTDATALGGDANVLFSIHMYCEWRKGGNDPAAVGTIKNLGIPIIVGEFGYQHASDGSCDIDEQGIMDKCQTAGVGWLAWSQKGNGSPVEYLDLCSDWNCSTLSSWGNTVVNGTNGSKTATTCSVFTTTANKAPTVSITSPANNASIASGTATAITANAADTDGTISKVDFYAGTILISTDNDAPYEASWTPTAAATYSLTAKATDNSNNVTTSAAISVIVTANAAPTVTLTAPSANQSIELGASVVLTATATDNDGSIAKVEFLNGTTLIFLDAQTAYTTTWTPTATGTYTVTAVATDNKGAAATSTARTITVTQPLSPYNGRAQTVPGKVEMEFYDLGGQGVAYSDNTPTTNEASGVTFRTGEGVDLETCTDVGGGYNLGYTNANEWVKYTINCTWWGTYKLNLRLAASNTTGRLRLQIDGQDVVANMTVPNTGGWQTWQTVIVDGVALTEGLHVLTITSNAQFFNLNYIDFERIPVTGLDQELGEVAQVFPNPFANTFQVLTNTSSQVEVLDVLGNIIETRECNGECTLGDNYGKGVYNVIVTNGTKSSNYKMIKN